MPRSTTHPRSRMRALRPAVLVLAMLAALVAVAQPAGAQQVATVTCAGQEATIVGTTPGVINGTDGDDVIVGTSGVDTINAGRGNDTICGLGGGDLILGGAGRDIILGNNGADEIRSGPGNDLIWGGNGNDTIRAGFGTDVVFGGPNADTISGGPGNDTVRGGLGDDIVRGNNGSDVVSGGSGDDVVGGGNGNDYLRGNTGDDDLTGGNGRGDRLQGGDGIDVCRDRGFNTVFGGCESDFELTLLHINDHHSHLNPDSGDLVLAGQETRVSQGGFPNVVAKINELSAANDGNVVKIHAGDAVTGTLFYSLFKGEADAEMMNEVCFDLFELGNHEFDDGDQGLADFLGFLADTETCDTTVLGANIIPLAGTPLAPTGGALAATPTPGALFEPFKVIDYNGDKVGYIGLDIAGKTMNSSSPLDTTMFLDEVDTAQQYIDQLTGDGIDKIVLVTHTQLMNDISYASQLTGVDVIVGGDSHTLLGNFAPLGLNTSGRYPYRTSDAAGSPVCIVQAWQYSWVVGELNVNFDEDGTVTSCDGTPHLLLEDSFQREPEPDADREELVGAARQAVLDFIAATPELSVVTPDPDAQSILEGYSAQVEVLEQEVVGTATVDLCLERIPGQGRSQICDVADTAVNGGDIQQLVTDAFRIRSFESDFAIQNSGGVRIDIPAGDVTIADVFELLPFANTIVNLEMTGTEIKAVLEDAIAFSIEPDGSTGAYPYASGLRFDVDLNAADGSRVSNIEMKPSGTTTWVPFVLGDTYTVATNSFVASGGDQYTTFEDVSNDGRVVDTFLDYAQSFIDYIELDSGGVLNKPAAGDYSTQNFTPLVG